MVSHKEASEVRSGRYTDEALREWNGKESVRVSEHESGRGVSVV